MRVYNVFELCAELIHSYRRISDELILDEIRVFSERIGINDACLVSKSDNQLSASYDLGRETVLKSFRYTVISLNVGINAKDYVHDLLNELLVTESLFNNILSVCKNLVENCLELFGIDVLKSINIRVQGNGNLISVARDVNPILE